MQSIRPKCSKVGHNNNEVNAVCMNMNCQEFRPCCLKCLQNDHKNHFEDVNDFNDVIQKNNLNFSQDILKFLENVKSQVESMLTTIKQLISQISELKISFDGSLQEINTSVVNYIDFFKNFTNTSDNKLINKLIQQSLSLQQSLQQKYPQPQDSQITINFQSNDRYQQSKFANFSQSESCQIQNKQQIQRKYEINNHQSQIKNSCIVCKESQFQLQKKD